MHIERLIRKVFPYFRAPANSARLPFKDAVLLSYAELIPPVDMYTEVGGEWKLIEDWQTLHGNKLTMLVRIGDYYFPVPKTMVVYCVPKTISAETREKQNA
jgi:hypothetical protein